MFLYRKWKLILVVNIIKVKSLNKTKYMSEKQQTEEFKRIRRGGKNLNYVMNAEGRVFKFLKNGEMGKELSV